MRHASSGNIGFSYKLQAVRHGDQPVFPPISHFSLVILQYCSTGKRSQFLLVTTKLNFHLRRGNRIEVVSACLVRLKHKRILSVLKFDQVALSPPWPNFCTIISPYPLVFNAPSSFFPVSWQICECVCMRESKRDVACSQLVSKVVWLVLGTPHIPGMPELYGGVTLLSPIHTKPQQWALLSESTSSSTSCPVSYQAEKLNDSNRKNSLADFLYR